MIIITIMTIIMAGLHVDTFRLHCGWGRHVAWSARVLTWATRPLLGQAGRYRGLRVLEQSPPPPGGAQTCANLL